MCVVCYGLLPICSLRMILGRMSILRFMVTDMRMLCC